MTLAETSPGARVRIAGFSEGMPNSQREYLQAYGLMPEKWVHVVQHSPVTVVQVEHTELAMEAEMARKVRVLEK